MTDLKRITDKIRKPLFWKRAVPPVPKDTTSTNVVEAAKKPRRWYSPSLVKFTALALFAGLFISKAAQGQFGIDLAAVLGSVLI